MMETNKLLFTVGPLEMDKDTMEIGGNKIPYFRTEEFSKINKESCKIIKELVYTDEKSDVILLTSSGTGAMEAVLLNTLNHNDKLLIINGGTFGQRFVEIAKVLELDYDELRLEKGKSIEKSQLDIFKNKGYTAMLVNGHETSTGVLYDLNMLGEFCKNNNMLFIVDAISTFLADKYYMDKWNIDVTIISSQKALALPPGMSIIVLNEKASQKVMNNNVKSLYFDLKLYLKDIKRGQTPFTPSVGIFIQLYNRLLKLKQIGIDNQLKHTKEIADNFRNSIKDLPLKIKSQNLSNALTPVYTQGIISAYKVYETLKRDYDIVVNPSGGDLKDKMFRVGHIGNLTIEDNNKLVNALKEIINTKNGRDLNV